MFPCISASPQNTVMVNGPLPHSGVRDLDATCAAALEECAKMLYFSHPNVLGLIGVCLEWGPSPVIILPFMANGCLLNYLKKERENLDCEDPNETDKVTMNCYS